jgi:hypothetical protein
MFGRNKYRCVCLLSAWSLFQSINPPVQDKQIRQKKPLTKRLKIIIALLVAVAFLALIMLLILVLWTKGYI